jgi:hypothetical protein
MHAADRGIGKRQPIRGGRDVDAAPVGDVEIDQPRMNAAGTAADGDESAIAAQERLERAMRRVRAMVIAEKAD